MKFLLEDFVNPSTRASVTRRKVLKSYRELCDDLLKRDDLIGAGISVVASEMRVSRSRLRDAMITCGINPERYHSPRYRMSAIAHDKFMNEHRKRIDTILANPDWMGMGLSFVAYQLGIHRTTLSNTFQAVGVDPSPWYKPTRDY